MRGRCAWEGREAQESRRAAQEQAVMEPPQPTAAGVCKLNSEELPALPSNGALPCRGDTGIPPPTKPAAAFREDAFGPEAEDPRFWPEICQRH